MSSIILIFNIFCIPFLAVYFFFRSIDVPSKPSLWFVLYYIFAVCAIGVPAKLTAMFADKFLGILFYHYQSPYSVFVLIWTFIIYMVSVIFIKNIAKDKVNK